MKIFLSADIEGTCGITDWSETERSTPKDYNPFQRQMTREVCAPAKEPSPRAPRRSSSRTPTTLPATWMSPPCPSRSASSAAGPATPLP